MKIYDRDSPEFAVQTAVMTALPHAVHPMHEDWRTKADVLIEGLAQQGFIISAPTRAQLKEKHRCG